MNKNVRLALLWTALGAMALLGVLAFADSSPTAIPVVGFHAPVAMPGSSNGTEPSIAIPLQVRAGLRFVTWQNPGEIATSLDGINFTNRGTRAGGGDVTNAADPSGALFFGQFCSGAFTLHACLERSLDGGATWPLHTDIADNHPGAADRPWIEVFPHKRDTLASAQAWNPDDTRVYMEYHTFTPEELAYVTVSADGGHTFSEAKLITSDTNALIASGCSTVPGGIGIDESNGTVYALWLSGNDVSSSASTGCNYTQIGPFNKAWVSKSTDGGNTWTASLAWQGAFDFVTKIGDNADKIFATISVDQAGQIHVVLPVRHFDDPLGFTLDCQQNSNCVEDPQDTDLLLVTSPDGGAHWTLPVTIEESAGSYFFPWITAGSEGIVNAVYYKSATRQPNRPNSVWYIGYTRVTDAVATYIAGPNATYVSTPQFQEQLLDPGPVHGNGSTGGGICTFGLFCSAVPGANRTLADSIAVTLDPAGGVNAVWTDSITPAGKVIQFTCQNSGPSSFAGAPDLNGCYGPADIGVVGTDSPDPVAPGGTLTYNLTVTNNSGLDATAPATTSGVTLTANLPAGLSLISATPGVGTCSGTGPVACDLGIFPGGASTPIEIKVAVPQGATGPLTFTASAGSLTTDAILSNNTLTLTTNTVTQTPTVPDLQVTNITATNVKPKEGDRVTVTATISNTGTGSAATSKTEFLLDDASVLGQVDTPVVPAGGSVNVAIGWDTRSLNGMHTIRVTADRTSLVSETHENNNSGVFTATVQGNKVKNGSFEQTNSSGSGPDGWSGSSTEAGSASWSDGGSDGSKSAGTSGNGGNAASSGSPTWTSDAISVTPGEALTFSMSISSLNASSAATAGLVYLGAAGNVLQTVNLITAPLTTTGFARLQQAVTIPAGVTQVRVKLVGFSPTDLRTSGTVKFDEVGLFGN